MAVTVVTLLVYPEQSERLALASAEGKIQLALRNPLDQGAPETPGMKQAIMPRHGEGARPHGAPASGSSSRKAVGPVPTGGTHRRPRTRRCQPLK